MTELLTPKELEQFAEIQRLLDEAYDHYFEHSDGCCKSSEGWLQVDFGTYFDRCENKRVRPVQVYSYVFGPRRTHHFESIEEALEAVRGWHEAEMTYDYSTEGGW